MIWSQKVEFTATERDLVFCVLCNSKISPQEPALGMASPSSCSGFVGTPSASFRGDFAAFILHGMKVCVCACGKWGKEQI